MMTLHNNINSIKMKTVGAVVFILLMLLMAGVEPNPGPADMLVFRYQYLLIEVATTLLRKLFDIEVNNDLMQFLKTNPHLANKLNDLINNNFITKDQQKFLPPLDKSPNTANFDITLLVCLLRNICGLKSHRDPVWQNPANGDLSVEAEITRIKECRNYIVHKGTVHISESDFNLKWKTLCQILFRLSKFCGVSNLTEMIHEAYTKPLDDQLKQQHDNILKAWHEAENLFEKGIVDIKIRMSEIQIAQSELKDGQSEMKDTQLELKDGQFEIKSTQSTLIDGQSELKDGQFEIKSTQSTLIDGQSELKDGQFEMKLALNDQTKLLLDVKEQTKRSMDIYEQPYNLFKCNRSHSNDDILERLQKSYQNDFRTLCVTPLFSEDDRIDMFTIYTRPEMIHVPYHKAIQSEDNYDISSFEQLFCNDNAVFRKVFVTGNAGMGKTSFGQFMSLLWSKAISGNIVGNDHVRKDASFMTNFDFVFYIALKETNREDVVSMIVDKYFFTSSKDEFEKTIKTIEHILRNQSCLVILDGLDEWRPDGLYEGRPDVGGNRNLSLPRKVTSDRCTYLTTCRPYIIETVRLSEMDIDHQVQITGFDHEKYIREVIAYINKSQNTNKNPDDFLKQINESGMRSQLHIPLITSQLIVVWFKFKISDMSRALVYGSIVEMLFERAINNNQIKFSITTSADVQFSKFVSRFTYLRKYVSSLEKVCLLSFLLLFDPNYKIYSLVFTKKQLMSEPYNISPEDIEYFCQIGIISKQKVIASFGEQEQMLSFLHQSYLEFLAALFVSFFDKTGLFSERVKEISISDIESYENFLVLLSGISSSLAMLFFEIIYTIKNDKMATIRRRGLTYPSDPYFELVSLQSIILSCLKEIRVSDNSHRFIKLEDYTFYDFIADKFDLNNLKTLLVMNKYNVKSLSTNYYVDVFTEIRGLQYLHLGPTKPTNIYDSRFTDVLLQNKLTLHSINLDSMILSSKLPLRELPYLTSICFCDMDMNHTNLHDLMEYVTRNMLLEHVWLNDLRCAEHSECYLTLNLSKHCKLHNSDFYSNDPIYGEIKTFSLLSRYIYMYSYVSRYKK